MGIEEKDMIDRAMDAAEAKIVDSVEAAPDAPAEDLVETQSIVEGQEREAAPADKTRGKDGKFVKGRPAAPEADGDPEEQVSDQVAEADNTEATAQGDEPQGGEPIEMPAFWSAEERAAVAKAPREVQAIIARKEAQRTEWANRIATETERARSFEKRLYADMDSQESVQAHKAQLQMSGIRDEVDELHRYRAWDRVFRTDARAGIAALMQKNGLSPYDFAEDANGSQYPNDPRIEEAARIAQEAKQAADAARAELDRERETNLISQVNAFRQGKDSTGQTRAEFAAMYAQQIEATYNEIKRIEPYTPDMSALDKAYEHVLGHVRKFHGIAQKPQIAVASKTPEQAIAQAKKAKAAAGSVSGAPSSGTAAARPRLKGKNFNEKLDAALDNAFAQAGE